MLQEETTVQDNESGTISSVFSDPIDSQPPSQEEKSSATEPIQPSKSEEEISKLIRTESVVCGDETYIFDTIFIEGKGYFNDVYKTVRSPENFLTRLKSQEWGPYYGAFKFLTINKKNCDTLYFTSIFMNTDTPYWYIFKWQPGDEVVTKIAVGDTFFGNKIPRNNKWISPTGVRLLIAEKIPPYLKNYCDYRISTLLNLADGTSEKLLELPTTENFDNGYSDLEPYCAGLDFGWIDSQTIYYDVYDTTKGVYDGSTGSFHPLIERRTLKIMN